jgi:pimeloyl-ACP methyl ester carboxylesterase
MQVTTPSGVVISVTVEGSGPPLMLITGTGDDYTRYARVSPILAQSYTLYNVDRRGRGSSTDAPAHSFLDEVHDMLAVIDAIEAEAGPVNMLAHSYGGLVGLETAWRTDKLKSVLLYEPPMPLYERIDGIDPRKPLVVAMAEILAKGDIDGVITFYLSDFMGSSPETVERQRSNPKAWERWRSMARTVPRELMIVRDYEFAPFKFVSVKYPVGILVGGKSRPGMRRAADRIKSGIPQAEIIELPGEGHSAMTSSPEMFASAVLAFLNGANR